MTSRARCVSPVWPIQYLYQEFIPSYHLEILLTALIVWCFSFSRCQGVKIPYENQDQWCRDFLELVKKGFTHLLTLIRWSAALEQWQFPPGEDLLLWTTAGQFNEGSAFWSSKLPRFLLKQIGGEELLAAPTDFSRELKALSGLQAQPR